MKTDLQKACEDYLAEIRNYRENAQATEELSLRPALDALLKRAAEILDRNVEWIGEPHRTPTGRPDFIATIASQPLGYVEAEAYGIDLDRMSGHAKTQNDGFRANLDNFILTNHLDFRLYVGGALVDSVRLPPPPDKGKPKVSAADAEAVERLLGHFLRGELPPISSPKDLATHLARRTRQMRGAVLAALQEQMEAGGDIKATYEGFKEVLLPHITPEEFADMYAQTITYGLFAARCAPSPAREFTRQTAADLVPRTNPFLRRLFQGIAAFNLDPRVAWIADDTARLLAKAQVEAILADFVRNAGRQDPVVHFYETFLAAYNPAMRELRGVYYTPQPVVSYIVRSIDWLLKTRFNKPMGLADENTLVLDPATGTASFLFAVIALIHEAVSKGIGEGAWNDYVEKKLLPRIFGFELLVAPYAVAHLKLGLLLQEYGYKFQSDQRLGIYLTNTLEEAIKKSEILFGKYISDEANEAVSIKRDKPILVVVGNPPYSGFSANRGEWITNLIADYRMVDGRPLGEKKVWLKNDYIKFIRFGQWRVELSGTGIVAFITDNSYLDSPTFRGMRQHLLKTFDEIYILNLHGNAKRRETAPDGGKDENVFDITQGVAIAFFVKSPKQKTRHAVLYCDLWGGRDSKYASLSETSLRTTSWRAIEPASPFFEFVPVKRKGRVEYQRGWRVTDIFPVGSNGVQTSRDSLVVAFTREELLDRFALMRNEEIPDAEIHEKFQVEDRSFWGLAQARSELRQDKNWKEHASAYLYRPFDSVWLYASSVFVHRLRFAVMRHLQRPNRLLCLGRAGLVASGGWNLAFCASHFCDHNLFCRGSSMNFPLYLYETARKPHPSGKALMLALFETAPDYAVRRPNISPAFLAELALKLGLSQKEPFGLPKGITPEDIFHYAYAVFHSPAYRERYAEFLKRDFPRLPLTSDLALFRDLAEFGRQLVALHLLDTEVAGVLNKPGSRFTVAGSNVVEKVRYAENQRRVYVNNEQYFDKVPKEAWEFHIGGYQVCEKWLKDRKGRELSVDDIQHYQRIIVALLETGRIMQAIDERIPGFPIR